MRKLHETRPNMLDPNVLNQLSQLKDNIIASKEYAEGTVIGAKGRYGFVKLPDGRNAFLNPDKMQRVIPGDKVKVSLTKNDKDQLEAHLEALLEKPLKRFTGRYRVKGGAHFVEPDAPHITRWLFVPPKHRQRCEVDDIVIAELLQHPYKDGKASAQITTRIGKTDAPYVHHNTVIAEYELQREWHKDVQKQTDTVIAEVEKTLPSLPDFTDIPFVTIDAASTRDMDDAVSCEPIQNSDSEASSGWKLHVAIAHPSGFIRPGSAVAKMAKHHAQSVYLPGRMLPMMPEKLATDTFSLTPEQVKPALVCTLTFDADGQQVDSVFKIGKVRSRHKLSYIDVSAALEGQSDNASSTLADCNEVIHAQLRALHAFAQKRQQYRREHHLVHEDQADHDWYLDKQGMIENIVKRERTLAHKLIEEAMLATNCAAAALLAEHKSGLFMAHAGIRHDRLGEARALLREELGNDFKTDNIDTLEGFLALVKQLQNSEKSYLLAPLKRMMDNSELAIEAAPHMNMGLPLYATISSPIRRYADLSNHWSIIQILNQQTPKTLDEAGLAELRESLGHGRQAGRKLEQTLTVHYLKDRIGMSGKACVRIVTQQGFGVRFLENGIEGFVQFPKNQNKQFDAKRMTLTVDEQRYSLDQEVDVKVEAVDLLKRRVKMVLA